MTNRTVPKVWSTLREVETELRKTTWPSRAEVIRSTRIVLGMLFLLGAYFAGIDGLLNRITQLVGASP